MDEMDYSDKKIELADQGKVKSLEIEIDEILLELGHENALVTDESELYFFLDLFMDNSEREDVIAELSSNLGVQIMDECELIVDIAQRIKDKKRS